MAKIVAEIYSAYYYQLIYESSLPEFPLKEIEVATENFKTSFGKSQYGPMYIGELSVFGKPTAIIVKRFTEHSGVAFKDFLRETYLLCDKRHPNVIRERIIVYEYPKHGRLDQYISRRNATSTLTWLQRLKICIGAAQGLYHLHLRDSSHGEFKSANILLDDKWVAKVYNFLMTTVITDHAYYAREYIINGIPTKEADVYAFGMVLFELLCGRLCTEEVDGYKLSGKLIKELYEKKKLDEMVDPSLREQAIGSNSVEKYSGIAYRCLLDDPKERPSTDAVIKELEELLRIEEESNNRFDQERRKLQERAKAVAERETIVVEREKRFDQESRKLQERAIAVVERETIAFEREKRFDQESRKLQKRAKAVAEQEKIAVEREKWFDQEGRELQERAKAVAELVKLEVESQNLIKAIIESIVEDLDNAQIMLVKMVLFIFLISILGHIVA